MRAFRLPVAVLTALFLTAAPLLAVEPDDSIDPGRLALQLKPLPRDEVQALAARWVKALQGTVQSAVDTRIELAEAEGEARAPLQATLEELAQRRIAMTERVEVVLSNLDAKGGDTKEYRQYLAAIGDANEELVAARGYAQVAWDWVTSANGGLRILKNVGLFLLIVLVFRIVAGIVGAVVRRSLSAVGRTPLLLRNFLANITRNVIFLIGLIVGLSQLGLDIGPLVAAIGGAGFVLAFALQSTLSNFAAGVMILLYRPYEIGDVVTVAGTTGKVEAMTLVSTTVLTPDNQVIVVPNSNIWGDTITNVTGNKTRRVDLVFGVGYDDDLAKVQTILEETAAAHEKVLETPAPVVKVTTLNASSVDFVCRPWCKTGDYWDVYWDLTRQVKERFDAEGISIPYPQTDVHLHRVAPREA